MTQPLAKMRFSELMMDWLVELGYTHCFFVAGGNIMHLLDGARTRMKCVPVAHEVAAGIAVEYFNESGGNRQGLCACYRRPRTDKCRYRARWSVAGKQGASGHWRTGEVLGPRERRHTATWHPGD